MGIVLIGLGFTDYGINSQTLVTTLVFALASALWLGSHYIDARRHPERRFLAMWSAVAFFDNEFARYPASRAHNILLVTMVYLYVVISFAGVYFHIDNCDHEDILCSFIVYERLLTYQSDSNELCWSFHSIPPLAYNNKPEVDLCKDHKTSEQFSLRRVLPYLYFSMVTSTVGYGDIYPISISAVWIVILHHLIAIIVFVGVVAQLANFALPQFQRPSGQS